ncbi:SUN domain-containing protein [Cordyceps fumosorosea ARSEF 2679]|uniref:SUN domain-containing protein n=1 Tax=Cordyceps fumosorosea (strain ARSEF 2679) TaxID=1081104 RepID=A0A167WPX4_CORFA|nr:SUN domain-containing protein [Cordyceps fumosorosea ARSEF 2679]OAA64065.1 SUN domain-containing protein [Cordyceps fumosorosea ARSEF 2679]
MKTFIQLTLAVTLAATVTASSHHHGHRHLHVKKDATKVDKREPDVVTKVVAGPTKIVYQLGNKFVDATEAKKGLDNGDYIIVGESTPTYTPPPAPSTTKDVGAQFIESKSTTTTTTPPPPPPTTTSTPPPPPPSSTAAAPVGNAASSDDGDASSSGGENIEFPSGKVPCSEFPSKYGAVPVSWMGIGGWAGIQKVANYPNAVSFDNIVEAVKGGSCTSGCMCSYACKPGYQKSQWPTIQGATGQSVGGIYCNQDGYLELTRESVKQLCTAGEGGVSIQNDLDQVVSTCRTNYPGNENMNIPTVAEAGQTVPLTNPSQSNYYQWEGKRTSAQYYINPKGVAAKDACLWQSPTSPNDRGNWAAVIAGVGKADDGITYISLFLNKPTSSAQPDFNMEIIGGNTKCGYHNGQWIGGDGGCTTGVASGKNAIIRYY